MPLATSRHELMLQLKELVVDYMKVLALETSLRAGVAKRGVRPVSLELCERRDMSYSEVQVWLKCSRDV